MSTLHHASAIINPGIDPMPLDDATDHAIRAAARLSHIRGEWFGARPGSPFHVGLAELVERGWPIRVHREAA